MENLCVYNADAVSFQLSAVNMHCLTSHTIFILLLTVQEQPAINGCFLPIFFN